ncbi:MAG: M48 family metallopeptidase [Bacteroidales bacterium]|nr:M48 family metallopeptidase [Bacteroidales bacterium]
MKKIKIRIPLELTLREKIYDALQGETVSAIMEMADVNARPDFLRNALEGQSFKVDRNLMKHYHDIFYGVKEALGFEEDIDFYVTCDSSVNAWTVKHRKEGEPNVININSGLLQLMNDDELKFVVGHEIGHLINGDNDMRNLVSFIFPEELAMPLALKYKIQLWSQLAELEADRYGFIACQNLDQCVSAFFKLTTGLNLDQINMDIKTLLSTNQERLEFFKSDNGYNCFDDHPVNPIRIEAINLFASLIQGKRGTQKKIDELLDLLVKMPSTPIDYYLTRFVATAGLLMANVDDVVTDEEYNVIIEELSTFKLFPREYLQEIITSGEDILKVFEDSVNHILELDAGHRPALLDFLITMSIVDRKIKKDEVNTVFAIGKQYLGFTEIEIAQAFALKVQAEFSPKTEDIV